MSIYKTSEVSLLDLTKLIGTLSSTIQAVLHACIQFLQQRQVLSPKQIHSKGKNELVWWVNNLKLCNGQLVIQPQVHIRIQTDTSNKRWGVVSWGIRTEHQWSKKEQDLDINKVKLLAVKFAILTFAKMWKMSDR